MRRSPRPSSSRPARPQPAAPRSPPLLVAVTAAELLWRNAASPLNAEPAERYAVFRELPPEQLQGLQVLKKELAERNAKGERPRVEILGLGGAWQNASMVLGLEDTIGYNPLRLADYEKAVGPGENAVDPNLRTFPGTFRGYKCRLASLLGLEYLVLDRPIERLPRHFPRLAGTKLLYGSGTMWIYRLNAARRAPISRRTSCRSIPRRVLEQAELPEFDRPNEALVDEASVAAIKGDYGLRDGAAQREPASGSVQIADYGRNQVTLEVETDRDSVVVLHDIYYPGLGGEGRRQAPADPAGEPPVPRRRGRARPPHRRIPLPARSRWTTSSPPRPTS